MRQNMFCMESRLFWPGYHHEDFPSCFMGDPPPPVESRIYCPGMFHDGWIHITPCRWGRWSAVI